MAILILLLSTITARAEKKDWTQWSERDAKKIVLNAIGINEGGGFGEMMGVAVLGGLSGGAKVDRLAVIWVTDPVLHALVRIKQLQERLTEAQAVEVYGRLREELKDSYTFYVSAISQWFFSGGYSVLQKEVVDTDNPNRIFLQYPKDHKVFLRPSKIEKELPELSRISSLAEIPSVEQEAIVMFPRDAGFMDKANGEVQFEMVQEGKVRAVKFKIKKLVEDPKKL